MTYKEMVFPHLLCEEQDDSDNNIKNIKIIFHRKNIQPHTKRKIYKISQKGYVYTTPSLLKINKKSEPSRHCSMPSITSPLLDKREKLKVKSSKSVTHKMTNLFQSNYIVNAMYQVPERIHPFNNQAKIRVYRCQISNADDSCCCACNSDAMFEVMKSLYDCYKKKNCDNCNCILCGHLPREERRLGELRKVGLGLETGSAKQKIKMKEKAEKVLIRKSPAEKEKILKDLAKSGVGFPKPKTTSEAELMKKVKSELGLPPEPTTEAEKQKLKKAEAMGLLVPLEGKTPEEKERILQKQAGLGIPLPEGRTPSEKAMIKRIKTAAASKRPSKMVSTKMREAKAEGLMTPLTGKTPEQQEKILRGLAMKGLPLPEGKTPSEKKMIDKVRTDLGLPPTPTTASQKNKYQKALAAGLVTPLEGKSPGEKENILRQLAEAGVPLPEGRTPSEKALIEKVKATAKVPPPSEIAVGTPSQKLKKAKDLGLLTPLESKTPEQKEKILRGLVKQGLPLPEGKTASEKMLINKIKAQADRPSAIPSAKMREAKAAGLLTPLEGKTLEQKEKILKSLAKQGMPLPEGKTASEKKLIDKVRTEMGVPPEPKTLSGKEKYEKARAAGLITPLEGKTPAQKEKILKSLAEKGIPLPEGRTPSEKALISKIKTEIGAPVAIPSAKLRAAKAAGLLTPLEGKTPEQKEKVLRGLAKQGLPLPEGKSSSEKKIIDKVRAEMGLPPEPKTASTREKYARAQAAGLITPLEGKTPAQKEKILKALAEKGIPLPDGRTPSEKAIISKIKAETQAPLAVTSAKLKAAKAAGLLTPLEGKTPEQKEKILRGLAKQGLPLPEGKTASEKMLINKIKKDVGRPSAIPSAKIKEAKAAGLLTPLEGKTPEQKEKILRGLVKAGLPLPPSKSASEKKLMDQIRAEVGLPPEPKTPSLKEKYAKAQAAGFMEPLEGKTPAQKEKILRGQFNAGIPLPEGRTPSEKALIAAVKSGEKRRSVVSRGVAGPAGPPALPPDERAKLDAKTAKVVKEGKGPSDECICGLLTPESERPPIGKPTEKMKIPSKVTSEKLKAAKAAGLLTPLTGKSPEQKERILKGLAKQGLPLPEGKTASEKKLVDKVRAEIGLPPEPKTASIREKYARAQAAGLITPLEGKTSAQKEKILKALAEKGIPLPEGRTPSEKALISKIKAETQAPLAVTSAKLKAAKAAGLLTPLEGKTPEQKEKILRGLAKQGLPLPEGRTASEKILINKIKAELGRPSAIPSTKLREARAAGLLTPLEGKTPEQKEKILKGLAKQGIPLPEAKSASEKRLIDKVRAEMGVPPEPKTPSAKERYARAQAAGLITPLQGKTPSQKEKVLKSLAAKGVSLPEGRTPSEKALISKVKAEVGEPAALPSSKLRAAKAAGLLTPLEGKTPEQKEKVLRGLAKQGLPLPEGKSSSEKKLIDKVRAEMGLPPEPKTASTREKYARAQAAGLITPLEGKTPAQKEKILKALAEKGIPLPDGRTPSEKAIISKIKAETQAPLAVTSAKLKAAKAAGLLTPLEGKTPEQKEKILRGLAKQGLPLPEGKTASEKMLINKIKKDVGRPSAIPSAKIKEAKAAGLLTPLEGKTPEQKEKILRGLVKAGLPLPPSKSASEKKLMDQIRAEVGLPPEPKTPSLKEKYAQAQAAGFMEPLEGKTPAQKEKILRGQFHAGIPLPEGRTPSEKALITAVKSGEKRRSVVSRGAAGPAGPPALPPDERAKLDAKTAKVVKEGKGPSDECICGLLTPESERPPIGKPTEKMKIPSKVTSEKLKAAKAAGLLTPLTGKSPEQKERILKGLAKQGLPLPEGKTASEKKLVDKVRAEIGLPPEPKTASIREKYARAQAAGLITPLEGKTSAQKEKILKALAEKGIPLPEGRTPSEKALISKIKAETQAPLAVTSAKLKAAKAAGLLTPLEGKTPEQKEKILRGLAKQGLPLPEGRTASEKILINKIKAELGRPSAIPSTKLREARAAGLLTPLEGKTPEQKEKILKGLAKQGIPLPEAKSASEKRLIDKVRAEMGVPPEPKTPSAKERYARAQAAGLITPLQGKTPSQKEKVLKSLAAKGVSLPEGRTPSEKALISKVKAEVGEPAALPSSKLRVAKAAGLLTPLEGKTPEQKEKVLRGLAKQGLPLPEGKSSSEKKLIDKVRAEMGLPPEPKTASTREKYARAQAAGLITPLEGKTPAQKEKILKALAEKGIPLPDGRTPSEKAIISKIKAETQAPLAVTSAKLKAAKAAGLLTPLEGKAPEQKEKILKGLAKEGLPLPEGKTPSEKVLIDKIRAEARRPSTAPGVGPPALPPDERAKLDAKTAKVVKESKGPSDECICGLLTPESERAPIGKLSERVKPSKVASEKIKAAKAAGLLTPLSGKTPQQKEKIIKGLAKQGLPLPEGKTASEKKILDKVRDEMGLPPTPKTPSAKDKYSAAQAAGLITPLEGKTPAQKEKILRALAEKGIPLPEGRNASERALINKIQAEVPLGVPSAKLREAKAAGLLTPLAGKTTEQKEKILRGLAKKGIPLPEGTTASEKKNIDKIRTEVGLPPEPKTLSVKAKYAKAQAAGIITPLEGKTAAHKEKILKDLAKSGIPLPEGKTASEKKLIEKVRTEMGLPPAPKSPTEKAKYDDAVAAGVIVPLEGKSLAEKEKTLAAQAAMGLPLPEGRTQSEKALISKIKSAKTAGLLTPLEGKTPSQKEKILKGLVSRGLPLPEGKTASEKKLIDKVRTEIGLPPEPRTPSERAKYDQALAAGVIAPLAGKSTAEKEKALRAQAAMGIPLPEGRTPSEKALISKIKSEVSTPAKKRIPSEKLRKAKEAGLLTPLTGKTTAQKEKILKGLAEAGLPLPEGKTPSEKALVQKMKTELGIPPTPVTPSEKEVIRKAKAAGFFTPLAGKTPKQKEEILKGLAEAGLPLPVGKTSSEKSMIKKIRTTAGLPPQPTPSEKLGKIKTKSKKVGGDATSARARGVGAKKEAGIDEEFQDVIKSTTCDRGCGCDKKKIRFKHSYVKIRVTSPDISSLCPCPEECVPGVKGGVFVDNEGIKVTVGSAVGFPALNLEPKYETNDRILSNYLNIKSIEDIPCSRKSGNISEIYKNQKCYEYSNDSSFYKKSNESISKYKSFLTEYDDSAVANNELNVSVSENHTRYIVACSESDSTTPSQIFSNYESLIKHGHSKSSLDSVVLVRTESSLSFFTRSGSIIDTISIISYRQSSIISSSSYYLCYSESSSSVTNLDESEYLRNEISYSAFSLISDGYRTSKDRLYNSYDYDNINNNTSQSLNNQKNDNAIYRISQSIDNQATTKHYWDHKYKNVVIINDLNSSHDIYKIIDKIVDENEIITDHSSLIVVVSTSDNNNSCESRNSTICIRLSDNYFGGTLTNSKGKSSYGLKICNRGKQPNFQSAPNGDEFIALEEYDEAESTRRDNIKHLKTQGILESSKHKRKCRGFGMDTISDRPCCCNTGNLRRGHSVLILDQRMGNVVSEIINPMMKQQSVAQGFAEDLYLDTTTNLPCQTSLHLIENTPRSNISCHNMQQCNLQKIPGTFVLRPIDKYTQCNIPNSGEMKNAKLLYDISEVCPPMVVVPLKRSAGCDPITCPTQPEPTGAALLGTIMRISDLETNNNNVDLSCRGCSNKKVFTKKTVQLPQIRQEAKGDQLPISGNPCPQQICPSPIPVIQLTQGTQYTEDEIKPAFKDCDCEAKHSKKKKNKCMCPPAPEEPSELYYPPPPPPSFAQPYDYGFSYGQEYDAIADISLSLTDKRDERKLKSDLTQTTSGFNMKFKKRPVVVEDSSIDDDAMFYFDLFRIRENDSFLDTTPDSDPYKKSCDCDDKGRQKKKKKDKKNVVCDCPPSDELVGSDHPGFISVLGQPAYIPQPGHLGYIPPPGFPGHVPEPEEEEPDLKGIKLKIGGKGSGSKGLSGICCFDRFTNKT